MLALKLAVFPLMLQIHKIKTMKKMYFIFGIGSFFFFMNDLVLNKITLILGADMNTHVSIEIHMT